VSAPPSAEMGDLRVIFDSKLHHFQISTIDRGKHSKHTLAHPNTHQPSRSESDTAQGESLRVLNCALNLYANAWNIFISTNTSRDHAGWTKPGDTTISRALTRKSCNNILVSILKLLRSSLKMFKEPGFNSMICGFPLASDPCGSGSSKHIRSPHSPMPRWHPL
jgi:hypothetical protein